MLFTVVLLMFGVVVVVFSVVIDTLRVFFSLLCPSCVACCCGLGVSHGDVLVLCCVIDVFCVVSLMYVFVSFCVSCCCIIDVSCCVMNVSCCCHKCVACVNVADDREHREPGRPEGPLSEGVGVDEGAPGGDRPQVQELPQDLHGQEGQERVQREDTDHGGE